MSYADILPRCLECRDSGWGRRRLNVACRRVGRDWRFRPHPERANRRRRCRPWCPADLLPGLCVHNDGWQGWRRGGDDNGALASRTGYLLPPIFIRTGEMLTTMGTWKVDVTHGESFSQTPALLRLCSGTRQAPKTAHGRAKQRRLTDRKNPFMPPHFPFPRWFGMLTG